MAFRVFAVLLFALVLSCDASRKLNVKNCGSKALLTVKSAYVDSVWPIKVKKGELIRGHGSYNNRYSGSANDVFTVKLSEIKMYWSWIGWRPVFGLPNEIVENVPCSKIPGCPPVVSSNQEIKISKNVPPIDKYLPALIPVSALSGRYRAKVEAWNQDGEYVACVNGEINIKVIRS